MFRCSQWNIYFCIAINLIASTPISICDARPTVQNSEDWKHCAQENHAIIVMYSLSKSITSKICLSLFKLDLRNYWTILSYLMISVWIARIDWYKWDCSFVLHCHSIYTSIFGIFAVTTVSLYSTRRLRYCNASHINSHL